MYMFCIEIFFIKSSLYAQGSWKLTYCSTLLPYVYHKDQDNRLCSKALNILSQHWDNLDNRDSIHVTGFPCWIPIWKSVITFWINLQECLLKYLELLHSVVKATLETHKNYILKRVRECDLNGKLVRLCSDKTCDVILSEEQCDRINKKLSNCAQNGTLTG